MLNFAAQNRALQKSHPKIAEPKKLAQKNHPKIAPIAAVAAALARAAFYAHPKIAALLLVICCSFAPAQAAQNRYKFSQLKELEYDPALAQIGKQLFFDVNLTPQKLSCNDCHNLNISGSGSSSAGVNTDGELNPPTVLNVAHAGMFFSDGAIKRIDEQVRKTLLRQPGSSKKSIEAALKNNSDYVSAFGKLGKKLTFDNAVAALVEFERALTTLNAPIDKYLAGDRSAISPQAKSGMRLFNYFGCASCHNGTNFGSEVVSKFNNNLDPNCQPSTQGLIKVPSLRNITLTAPYGLHGEYLRLDDIVRVMIWCQTSVLPEDRQVDDIMEFLKTLEGKRPRILENDE